MSQIQKHIFPNHLSHDNLLQGPSLSEWAPELDELLNEIIEQEAAERAWSTPTQNDDTIQQSENDDGAIQLRGGFLGGFGARTGARPTGGIGAGHDRAIYGPHHQFEGSRPGEEKAGKSLRAQARRGARSAKQEVQEAASRRSGGGNSRTEVGLRARAERLQARARAATQNSEAQGHLTRSATLHYQNIRADLEAHRSGNAGVMPYHEYAAREAHLAGELNHAVDAYSNASARLRVMHWREASAHYEANLASGKAHRASTPARAIFRPGHASIDRATTTAQVQTILQAAHPHMTVELGGAHLNAAKDIAHQIADLSAAHPKAMRKLEFLGVTGNQYTDRLVAAAKARQEADGYPFPDNWGALYSRAMRSIFIQRHMVAIPAAAQEIMRANVADGWWAAAPHTNPARYLVRHEFGHHIDNMMSLRHNGASQALSHLMDNIGLRARDELSSYAQTNKREAFAEAFATLQFGTQKMQQIPYVRHVRDVVDAFGE